MRGQGTRRLTARTGRPVTASTGRPVEKSMRLLAWGIRMTKLVLMPRPPRLEYYPCSADCAQAREQQIPINY